MKMMEDAHVEFKSLTFESRRSLHQVLTFKYATKEFRKRNLGFSQDEMRTLGLLDAEGQFTNLALLLSDQCPSMIKVACFSDDKRNTFLAREEYAGSILKQLADSYAFLERNNHFRTEFKGLERADFYDYPQVAMREALINSVAHREYALSGPTLVSVMPSSLEIVSLGGLPLGIEYEDLSARISMPRNRMLSNIMFRLELIEAYGTGIGRMRTSYESCGMMPEISVTANTFSVSLPNRNAPTSPSSDRSVEESIFDSLPRGGEFTRADIQKRLNVSQSTAGRLLAGLVSQGKLIKEGAGKNTRYRTA